MITIRKLATLGTAAVVALTLAAPASAKQPPRGEFSRTAVIDCGDGPVKVGTGEETYAPLVDLRTGKKYKPIAFDVSGDFGTFQDSIAEPKKHSAVCSYDDGEAAGTVTVKKA